MNRKRFAPLPRTRIDADGTELSVGMTGSALHIVTIFNSEASAKQGQKPKWAKRRSSTMFSLSSHQFWLGLFPFHFTFVIQPALALLPFLFSACRGPAGNGPILFNSALLIFVVGTVCSRRGSQNTPAAVLGISICSAKNG